MAQILKSGDTACFEPASFPVQLVGMLDFPLTGSGHTTVYGAAICLEGDVLKAELKVAYTSPAFPLPGTGTLMVEEVMPDAFSLVATDEGERPLLEEGRFMATFKPESPAKSASSPPVPDPTLQYPGLGTLKSKSPAAEAS